MVLSVAFAMSFDGSWDSRDFTKLLTPCKSQAYFLRLRSMSNFIPIDFHGRPLISVSTTDGQPTNNEGQIIRHTDRSPNPRPEFQNEDDSLSTARHPERTTTGNMDHAGDGSSSQDIRSQIDAALGSIKQRLENIEERNRDPLGDVKSALKFIEASRLQLAGELSKMYQANIDQMSQAAKALGTWHGQMKTEVHHHCDERNIKLHKAGEEIFKRLHALERASTAPALEEHNHRIDKLETSAKSCVSNMRFNESVTRARQLEDTFRKQQHREDTRSEQYKQRIDTLRKAVQESSSCAIAGLDTAEKECLGRHDDVRGIFDKIDARLSKLEGNFARIASLGRGQATQAKPEGATKTLDSHSARMKQTEEDIKDLRSVADHLSATQAKHEGRARARDDEVRSATKQIELALAQIQKRPKQPAQATSQGTQEDLVRRLNNLEEHARTSAVHHNASRSDQTDIKARLKKLESIVDPKHVDTVMGKFAAQLQEMEARTSEASLQQRVDTVSARNLATLTDLVGRTNTLETESQSAGSNVQQQLQATRARVEVLEESSIAAAIDSRFEAFTETLAKVREHIAADHSKGQIDSQAQRLATLEETFQQQYEALQEHERHKDLVARVVCLEQDVQNVNTARGIRGQVIDDLIKRTEEVSTHLGEKREAMGKVTQEIASLSNRHSDFKENFTDLKEVVEDTRSWVGRVSEKGQRDGQAILGRLQLCDREHNLRLKFAEDGMERLRDELQTVRSLDLSIRPRRPASLADDIRRLRQRMDEADLNNDARRQLPDLARLIVDGSLLTASERESSVQDTGQVLQDELTEAATQPTPRALRGENRRETVSDQILGKRRRLSDLEDDSEDDSLGTMAGARGDNGPRDEMDTPRRSGRSGKGKNRRLEDSVAQSDAGREKS